MASLSNEQLVKLFESRQVAAFFLGGVFITSLNYCSVWIRSFCWRFAQRIPRRRSTTPNNSDIEEAYPKESSVESSTGKYPTETLSTLVFALSICFAFTSVAYFSSLLTFNPDRGRAACAFLVAWGGMAAQAARIVGLVILLLSMSHLGASRTETFVFIAWVVIGTVFVFVNNAISTGTLNELSRSGISICDRNHKDRFLPTALVSSLIFFGLEVYALVRLVQMIMARNIIVESLSALKDIRAIRAFSLIVLELLTMVPAVMKTNVLGDFVPLSIGALVVLATFNSEKDTSTVLRSPRLTAALRCIPSPSNPITRASQWLFRRSTMHSTPTATTHRSTLSPSTGNRVASTTVSHPFSAQSLSDPAVQGYGCPLIAPLYLEMPTPLGSPRSLQERVTHVGELGKRAVLSQPVVLSLRTSGNHLSPHVDPVPRRRTSISAPPLAPVSLLMGVSDKPISNASVLHPANTSRSGQEAVPDEKFDHQSLKINNISNLSSSGHNTADNISPQPLRRYSISTLASPDLARDGALRDSIIDRANSVRRIRLLTFESSFRVNDAKSLQRSPDHAVRFFKEKDVPSLPSFRPQV